jgi:predicted RNA-binding protein with RPS1 domain
MYQVGQIIEGEVTGIQAYGAFIQVDKETSGLIHISEISDGYVKDIHHYVNVGDKIKLKVLEVDEGSHHLRLSLKALRNSRKSRPRHKRVPKLKNAIGFESLREKLDTWIEVAHKEIRK